MLNNHQTRISVKRKPFFKEPGTQPNKREQTKLHARKKEGIHYSLKGTQAGQSEVRIEQTSAIRVKALKGTLPVHCDGKTLCKAGSEFAVKELPQALRFVTPSL